MTQDTHNANGGDLEAVTALIARGDVEAIAAYLYDRFCDDVNRMVWHFMGQDSEHDDVVNEVFLRMCTGIHNLRDVKALHGWAMSIAVNTVRGEIRRRQTVRKYGKADMLPFSQSSDAVDFEGRDMLEKTYEILDQMSDESRTAFTLRYIDQNPVEEVAVLCEWSLSTTKRRLRRAEKQFASLAKQYPPIYERLVSGGKVHGVG